ncbi:MAG: hypothetical protein DDT22_00942 [candidate division WS2 bacterium]|nr:hypothetical protein [Bacillota bacterium]MBT9175268.1 hypothetical protein [Candidatus Lithacetigena glycinireducens]
MITLKPEIEQDVVAIQDVAINIIIVDNDSYVQAGEIFSAIKELQKKIKKYFKPLKENAHKSWKQICDRENEELEKLTLAIEHLNAEMVKWNIAQEKIRRLEEERLRQEALQAEEERKLAEALQAEKEGDKEVAEAILGESVFVPLPVVEKSVPKIAGQTMTTNWRWRIKDERLIPREYLKVDDTKINGVVRALKGNTRIAGIEVYPENSMRGVRT